MKAPPKTIAKTLEELGIAGDASKVIHEEKVGGSNDIKGTGSRRYDKNKEDFVSAADQKESLLNAETENFSEEKIQAKPVVSSFSGNPSGSIVPLHSGAPGSLPVLEAIQAFIAEERRIMRKRFRILAVSSAAAILFVIAVSCIVGFYLFGKMRQEIEQTKSSLISAKEKTENLHDQANKTLSNIEAVSQTVRNDLVAEKKAISAFKNTIDSQISNYSGELNEIKEVLKMLQMENESLKEKILADKKDAFSPVVTSDAAGAKSYEPVEAGHLQIVLISRADEKQSIWRIPLPE